MSGHPVVEYLRTNSVTSLERLGIYARWSTVHPEKFSLNYDQIEAIDGVASVMSSANTDKGLTSIILSGTADDVRQWLPVPRQARLDELAQGVRAWAAVVERLADEAKGRLPDRKAAALANQATPHVGWIGTILDIATGKAPNVSAWIAGRKSAEGVLPPSLVEKVAVAAGGV